MFNKIKKIFFNIKALIVLLIVLIIIGWGLTVYFGLKINSESDLCLSYQNKIEKLSYYSDLLKESTKLIHEDKSLDVLESDVRLLENGALLAEWENAIATNKKEDAEHYLDVIIDSLTFFSK
ncbi:MAG: hypothetical protein V1686_01340 [Patescibacteria group bacterium]